MFITDHIKTEMMVIPMKAACKFEAIEELLDVLVANGGVDDRDQALADILAREDQCSTGLENGIAIPHAKSGAVKNIKLAFGIAPDGIDFDAMDGQPSKIFFLILAAPDQAGPHIKMLTDIAKITQSNAFRRALASCESSEEVMELFEEE